MLAIPLQPVPSQVVSCVLGAQPCQINVYQKSTGMFVDLYINDTLIIGGVIAYNYNYIVRSAYLGFSGDLVFADTQGLSDPTYDGLGSSFVLLYLSPSEIATAKADLPSVIKASLQSMYQHDFSADFSVDFG